MQTHEAITEENDESRFITFSLAGELYGVSLLSVREVIQPSPIKPMPNTVTFFLGVVNLRGQIVGVIDLRMRFNLSPEETPEKALLVFNTDAGPLAACVDQIHGVVSIPPSSIEQKENVVSSIPSKYLTGVAIYEEKLVTLIDLEHILVNDDLLHIRSKLAA